MNNGRLVERLDDIGACLTARDWVGEQPDGLTVEQLWGRCKNLDWMVWFVLTIQPRRNTEIRRVFANMLDQKKIKGWTTPKRGRELVKILQGDRKSNWGELSDEAWGTIHVVWMK